MEIGKSQAMTSLGDMADARSHYNVLGKVHFDHHDRYAGALSYRRNQLFWPPLYQDVSFSLHS
jgi:hypothetical protein